MRCVWVLGLAAALGLGGCGGADGGPLFGASNDGGAATGDASVPEGDAGTSPPLEDGGTDAPVARDGSPTDAGPDGALSAEECRRMDIVFVVDNSGSMGQEQENLVANFPRFVQALDAYRNAAGAPLDYRVAVTTTDITADKGAFRQSGKGCTAGPARAWLERADPDLAAAFACRATVGTGGSSTEQPLTALGLALTDRIADGTNRSSGASFVRDDALLAFIVLTDEDESNTTDVAKFVSTFDTLKSGRARWAAATIAGPAGGCQSTAFGSALDAARLRSFVALAGKNATFSSICAGDLTPGLTQALTTFQAACQGFTIR